MAAPLPKHSCDTEIPYAATLCSYCGLPVGIPNVRAAEAKDEADALQTRLKQAQTSADAIGSRAALDRFQTAAGTSEAVVAMHLMPFVSLIESKGTMISTFYGMVDAGIRLANNEHDVQRGVLDQAINPLKVHENIRFAALSLNREGLTWFGNIHLTLADNAIAGRASVFEENPLTFFDNKGLSPAKPIPPGYRAPWERRGDLAAAKLHHKVRPGTKDEEFAHIIMEQGANSDSADYIEVHIYGPVMPKAISHVTSQDIDKSDAHFWKRALRRLGELDIAVSER